jgi:pyrroline-5-carboxylate reductase
MKNLVIIGGGNMGGAIFKAIYRDLEARGSLQPEVLTLVDLDLQKLEAIREELLINNFDDYLSTDPSGAIVDADYLLLAIKPQIFPDFAASLQKLKLKKDLIYLSVMAGVTQEKLQSGLNSRKTVRAMPNLPAQIGLGVTGFFTSKSIESEDLQNITSLIDSFSTPIEVKQESLLDALTAVSGSGPAYFFYLTEILAKYAEDQGFSSDQAQILATKTLIGAAGIIEQSDKSAQEWKEAVTSKGGTTEAALGKLSEQNWPEAMRAALEAAKERSYQLGIKI